MSAPAFLQRMLPKLLKEPVPKTPLHILILHRDIQSARYLQGVLKEFGAIEAGVIDENAPKAAQFPAVQPDAYDFILIYPHYEFLDESIRALIEMKHDPKRGKIIVFSHGPYAAHYFRLGIDYFLDIDHPNAMAAWVDHAGKEYTLTSFLKTTLTGRPEYMDKGWSIFTPVDLGALKVILTKLSHNIPLTDLEKTIVTAKAEFYNVVAGEIFDARSRVTADTRQEIEFLKDTLKAWKRTTVLDGGCGSGRLTQQLADAGFTMTGVDISKKLIEEALAKRTNFRNPRYECMDLFHMGFPAESFSAAILMWHVICEAHDKALQEQLLREVYRVLKREGVLIFDFPDKERSASIQEDGTYQDAVRSVAKYVGLVPDLQPLMVMIETIGFRVVRHHRMKWGVDKYVLVCQKMGDI